MKTKKIFLTFFTMIFFLISFGQNKILLTNGQTLDYLNIKAGNSSVVLSNDSLEQSVEKTDILCAIPVQGKCFTYKIKNNRMLKLRRKFVNINSHGIGRARLFATKYFGAKTSISDLYILKGTSKNHFFS